MSTDTPQAPSSLRPAENATQKVIRQKVWKRMNIDNEHFMCAIVGREGKAKSHTALKIAKAVDPTFNAERVFFDPVDVLEAYDDGGLGTGKMIVLDEAGAGMGNRTWYDRDQIKMNQALQTVRSDNMGLIHTLPRLSELDSQARGRLHAYIEMIDKFPQADQPYAVAKWKNISPTRDERDKLYKKYPRIRIDGIVKRITRISFTPPDKGLVEEYEPRKKDFKAELNEEARSEAVEDEEEKLNDPKEIADDIKDTQKLQQFIKDNHGQRYIDRDEIELSYGIGARKSGKVKKLLLREVDDDVM